MVFVALRKNLQAGIVAQIRHCRPLTFLTGERGETDWAWLRPRLACPTNCIVSRRLSSRTPGLSQSPPHWGRKGGKEGWQSRDNKYCYYWPAPPETRGLSTFYRSSLHFVLMPIAAENSSHCSSQLTCSWSFWGAC